jgi:hypothetical protein
MEILRKDITFQEETQILSSFEGSQAGLACPFSRGKSVRLEYTRL